MNHAATSKEALLEASLAIARTSGLQNLGIRDIARACGISVGCVYRYFPSKAELLSATVEQIWRQIFHQSVGCGRPQGFRPCVDWVYGCIRSGSAEYPSFFSVHSAGFGQNGLSVGRAAMEHYLGHIQRGLLQALQQDPDIRPGVFDQAFTAEDFTGFVLENLLALGTRQEPDCGYLLSLIGKLLY